ncbi:MAG: indole-3-glycerol phosphate synthase TrpC [Candidatus Omnitrophica bacterium]|nr:indole-3-glycerol phosphate synthase TrpC [Candidatus Omnitrophota bacterium]
MSVDFLNQIVAHKKQVLVQKKESYDRLRRESSAQLSGKIASFKKAISKSGQMNLIAEIKKASPSKGILRQDFDALKIAEVYVQNGASALSVLTEEKFFLGSQQYLRDIHACHPQIPLLMKDFVIDEGQIYEARACGASAILLIVAILGDEELKSLINRATDLDLESLIEIHDEDELRRALKAGAEIIGINHRNLRTFDVSLDVSRKLVPQVPKNCVVVAESGIQSHQEIEELHRLGVHAVLIGETFMRSQNIPASMQSIMQGQ